MECPTIRDLQTFSNLESTTINIRVGPQVLSHPCTTIHVSFNTRKLCVSSILKHQCWENTEACARKQFYVRLNENYEYSHMTTSPPIFNHHTTFRAASNNEHSPLTVMANLLVHSTPPYWQVSHFYEPVCILLQHSANVPL